MAKEEQSKEEKPKEIKVEEKKQSTFKKAMLWVGLSTIAIIIIGSIFLGIAFGTLSAKAVLITIIILLVLTGGGIWAYVYLRKKSDMETVVKELTNKEAQLQAGFDIEEDFGKDKPKILTPMQPVPLAKKSEKFKFNFIVFGLEHGEKRAYLINRLNSSQKAYIDITSCLTEDEMMKKLITRAEQLADIEKRQKIVRKTDSAGNVIEEIVDAEIIKEERYLPFEG